MEVQITNLGTFNPPLLAYTKSKLISISPNLDKILTIAEDGKLILYFTYDASVITSPYTADLKYQSARFSVTGEKLAVVTDNFKIRKVQILRWQGRHVSQLAENSIEQLKLLSTQLDTAKKPSVIDSNNVQCLFLDKNLLVLLWNKTWLLGVNWNSGAKWSLHYTTEIIEHIKDCKVNNEMVYILTENGLLLLYNIRSGTKCHTINLVSITSQEQSLLYFTNIAVSANNFAVADWNDQIYVFALEELKAQATQLISRASNAEHVLSQSASEITAHNHARSSYRSRSESVPAKSSCHQFQKSGFRNVFSGSSNVMEDFDASVELEIAMVTALERFSIQALGLSECGLSVWYTNSEGVGLYRVYNTATGACVAEESLEPNATPILAGFLGEADIIISPTSLQVFFCNLSKEILATKLLQKVGVSSVSQALKGPGWQDINVALPVLSEGVGIRQIEIIRFALKIHFEGFKRSLSNSLGYSDIENICMNLKKLHGLLLTGIEDNLHSMQLAETLVMLALNHNYDLLSILYPNSTATDLLETVEQMIMKSVLSLRSYLYHPPDPPQVGDRNSAFPAELEGMSASTKEMWQLWTNLPDEEIIYQAIDHDFIPLAQTFFVSAKGKSFQEASVYIETTVNTLVHKFLCEYQISQCLKLFKNLCRDPMKELKNIYMNTSEQQLQTFLFGYLSNHEVLTEEEINAGLFLRQIIQMLQKSEIGQRHSILLDENKLQFTVGSVMKQSSTWRDLVWAELAFNLDDAELRYLVKPTAAWSYLLIANRPDLLQQWVDMQFSADCSTPTEKSREDADTQQFFKFRDLFQNWAITQEMIDSVKNAECTKFTKDEVLDQLSRYGIFSSTELYSLSSILHRFIHTDNLTNIYSILHLPTSNLTSREYSAMVLRFCIQHRMSHLLFSCLANVEGLAELVDTVDVPANSKLWLQSWLDLIQLCVDPEHNFLKAAESSLHYLAGDKINSYLEERPLLIMILIILSPQTSSALLSGEETRELITPDLLQSLKKSLPVLEKVLTQDSWSQKNKPDITLYELLEKTSDFDVTKLFGWQDAHRKKSDDALSRMPNFSTGNAYEKYAYHESINYEYYLRQGRPTYAFCKFVLEQFKFYKKMSKKRSKEACNIAHGLALCNFSNTRVTAGCISFMEMLGISSDKARVHVTAGNLIQSSSNFSGKEEDISSLLQRLMNCREIVAPQILSLLELALVPSDVASQKSSVKSIEHWVVAVKFARIHNLPLPVTLPIAYCKADMWLHFILCLEIYQYPMEQALHCATHFKSKNLQDHLSHAFSRSLDASNTPSRRSPRKEAKLKLRDSRKFLYSKIGLRAEDRSNDSASEGSLPAAETMPLGMVASSWSSDSSSAQLGIPLSLSSSVLHLGDETHLFPVIIACHNSLDPPQALLSASCSYNCPVLAVLASCYENCCLVSCMCTWLLVSMAPNAREEVEGEVGIHVHQQAWTPVHVQKLLIIAIRSGYISTLATALKVFSPENPLCALIYSIQCCAVDKNFEDSVENIHIFKAKCQNLPVAISSPEEGSFLCDRQWVYSTAVQLVCTTLARSFTSTFYQYRFLQMLCQTEFSEFITVESPDFAHLQQLQECLLETGVQLDYSALCLERRGSERELQACLDRLVLTHNFAQALKLARIAGLPRDSVVMAQWNNAIEQLENTTEVNRDFWKKCQSAFEEANIQPLVAAEFFQQHADTRDSKAERYLVLRLSHYWYSLGKQLSVRKRPDCYLTKAVEVELEMWKARLQLHVSEEFQAEEKGAPRLFTKTKKEVMAEAGVGYLELETRLKDVEEIAALDCVIGDLLDQGDISTAVRLEGLFCHKNRDVQILLTCMSLAEGEIQACQLSSEQRMMIDNSFATPSSFRKRPLHSLRVPSFTSLSPSPQSPQNALNSSGEYLEIPAKEQQDTLTALEKLSERLQHGKFMGARITACYRVAIGIEKAFVDIITIDDPLSLLKSAISKDCMNKFAVASDLSSGNQISKETMVQFLCEEIMTAVSKGHMQGEVACAFPPAGGIMWGCELDSCFHLVLELCPDSSLLGNELLNVASRFTSSQHEGAKQVHSVLVELLIRAHDCFTASCDMEGITKVLQKTRTLTPGLLQQEQWQLMVRMVTGIGRYTEMNYIFQILKDHQRFEFLLGKGMDKVPGLKLALLEFVRSRCAEDRELLRMVALHFRLYSQVAQLWDSEARTTVHRLLNITKLELGTKLFNQNNLLRASQDTVHLLKLAMQSYTHAAEYYLQADKLIKAMHSSHQAELVALQISMVNGVAAGQTVDCLLERESEGVNKLIYYQLNFPQTVIVARAYSHSVDWGLALFNHCVLQTEHKYLTDFTQAMNLTPTLVEDVVKRFHASQKSVKSPKAVPQEMYWVMKQMVNLVQCVEVKYRLASLLGFKDVLENMVTSPALPFLKDTVWRKSSKH